MGVPSAEGSASPVDYARVADNGYPRNGRQRRARAERGAISGQQLLLDRPKVKQAGHSLYQRDIEGIFIPVIVTIPLETGMIPDEGRRVSHKVFAIAKLRRGCDRRKQPWPYIGKRWKAVRKGRSLWSGPLSSRSSFGNALRSSLGCLLRGCGDHLRALSEGGTRECPAPLQQHQHRRGRS